jgi:hypothetical protein
VDSSQWQSKEAGESLRQNYTAFLCRQERRQEAAALGGCSPEALSSMRKEYDSDLAATHPQRTENAGEEPEAPLKKDSSTTSSAPVLYIVEVPPLEP